MANLSTGAANFLLKAGTPGLFGGLTAWLARPHGEDGLTVLAVLLVVTIGSLFGMISSLSRLRGAAFGGELRTVAFNAGAVITASFALAMEVEASVEITALIGLGVGLGGTPILEIFERGAIALAARAWGSAMPVSKDEMDQAIGDLRNQTQAMRAEQNRENRTADKAKDKDAQPEDK